MRTAKLLTVGKGGVTAYVNANETCSGCIGHNWMDDVGPETVVIDSRELPWDIHCTLAISGPMVDVDLPTGMVSKPFSRTIEPFALVDGKHNARSLDFVSLDVYIRLYEEAGAPVYRGQEAYDFARTISR